MVICIGIDLEISRNELPEPGRIPEVLGSFDNRLVPCGRERLTELVLRSLRTAY